jgi:hypothetical protein
MIWHIFRKDLRLLWVTAGIVAAVNLLNGALLMSGGSFTRMVGLMSGGLGWISNAALPFLGSAGLVLLVIAVVQADPLPGTTQDWLTRPIPRGQLFAAKLLFVVLLGLAPILIADIGMGMALQFRPGEVVAVSLTRSLALLCLVCIPAALVGAVTRTFAEALVFALGLAALLTLGIIGLGKLPGSFTLQNSGLSWISDWALIPVSLIGLALVVPLQMRWRTTRRVRVVLVLIGCLILALFSLPWVAAFRIQQMVGAGGASPLTVNLDPLRRIKFRRTHVQGLPKGEDFATVTVPVKVGGVSVRERIYVDRVAYRVLGPTGVELFRGAGGEEPTVNNRAGGSLLIQGDDEQSPAAVTVTLPASILAAARSAPVRIELDLYATTFRRAAEWEMSSARTGFTADRIRCAARRPNPQAGDTLFCESTRELGECFDIRQVQGSGAPGKSLFSRCGHGSYAPWPLPVWRDAYHAEFLGGFGLLASENLRADGARQLLAGSIVIASFDPSAHYQRRIDFDLGTAVEAPTAGELRSVDGIGPSARFAFLQGMVADRRGNLYLVDSYDSVIRRVTPSGEVSTPAGRAQQTGTVDGAGSAARFNHPGGIAIDADDDLYVADTGNGLIRKVTPEGVVSTVNGWIRSDRAVPEPLRFNRPVAVAALADGTLYVIDQVQVRDQPPLPLVHRIAPDGRVTVVAGPGEDEGAAPP